MNKSMLLGTLLGAAGATAAGAMAGYTLLTKGPEYAEVLNVEPITETIRTPRQECRDELVTRRRPVKDPHQITGTVVGAVVGGILGNQIGGGSGKKLATAAGAAAGGYAGNKAQETLQGQSTYTSTEQRCHTVTDTQEKIIGYDVEYRLEGKIGTVRMDRSPGERIPVEDGRLVLSRADAEKDLK